MKRLILKKYRHILCFIFFIIAIILYYQNAIIRVNENFFLDSKCPACYGRNLCEKFLYKKTSNDVVTQQEELKIFSRWNILNVLNVKNVFYGKFANNIYVLKKLAHNSELAQFDNNVCLLVKNISMRLSCEPSMALTTLILQKNKTIERIVQDYNILFEKSHVVQCKDFQLINYLWKRFQAFYNHKNSLENFITLLAINPEPLFLIVSISY